MTNQLDWDCDCTPFGMRFAQTFDMETSVCLDGQYDHEQQLFITRDKSLYMKVAGSDTTKLEISFFSTTITSTPVWTIDQIPDFWWDWVGD